MSSTNVLICSQRLLTYVLKTPVLQKHLRISCLNRNFSKFMVQSRLISNAVHLDGNVGKDFNEKSEHEKISSYNKKFEANEIKDFQLSDDHNPDVFGTLNKNFKLEMKLEEMPEEEGDVHETVYYNEKNERIGRLTINKYGKIIKYFLNKKKLGNAIDVLETRMLKEDKVKPDKYIYNLLISGCAKFGYTKMAFQLFNQMKKMGLQPTPSTYTSLLNACSTSPWTHDGAKRLKRLREIMIEKGYTPNQQNYHAMIKAYGRCKDLESAFSVVDEMIEKKVRITNETFNFLLQACITDTEAGLRHALLVWNKMLSKGFRPNIYTFNLMLRCTRDCGLGSLEATSDVIQKVIGSSEGQNLLLENSTMDAPLKINDSQGIDSYEQKSEDSLRIREEIVENRPNLLSRYPHLGDIIGLTDIKLPEHRLVLLGGCDGVLREMKLYQVQPDIKTFTQLLESIPSTMSAEQGLLNNLSKLKVQPDIDFFNILIKKRSMRYDYKNAKEVLKLIQKHMLSPDIVTFGVMALSCSTLEEAEQLVHDLDEFGYRLNIQILGALLRNAFVSWDVKFIKKTMKWLLDENITPSPSFMNYLSQFYSAVLRYQKMNEENTLRNINEDDKKFIDKINDKEFMDEFKQYCRFYKQWRNKVIPEEPVHPFTQFQKHDDPEDVAVMNTGRSSVN